MVEKLYVTKWKTGDNKESLTDQKNLDINEK